MHQVLVNLVVNAMQAMPQGGTITIETRLEKEFIRVMVKDTGIGMTEKIIKHIFIPFTTKEVGEGTGLGLSVVHGIVTAHGGKIEVESAPGRGATFKVTIPLNRQLETAENKGDGKTGHGKKHTRR